MSREADLEYVDKLLELAGRASTPPADRKVAMDEARRVMDRLQAEPAAAGSRAAPSQAALRAALKARLAAGRGGVERAGSGRTVSGRWSTWVTDPRSGEIRRVQG